MPSLEKHVACPRADQATVEASSRLGFVPFADSPATYGLVALIALAGYVVGSFSSGYIVGKLYRNVDLRDVGSGSTGSTNALRALGPGAAGLVAILDIAKGALAVYLAQLLVPAQSEWRPISQAVAGTTAAAGPRRPITPCRPGGRGGPPGLRAPPLLSPPPAPG